MVPELLGLSSILDPFYIVQGYLALARAYLVLGWEWVKWGYECLKVILYFPYVWIAGPVIYVFWIVRRIFWFFWLWGLFIYVATDMTWSVWNRGNWIEYWSHAGYTFFRVKKLGKFTGWTLWTFTRVSGSVFFLIFLICMWFQAPFVGYRLWGERWLLDLSGVAIRDECVIDYALSRLKGAADLKERHAVAKFILEHFSKSTWFSLTNEDRHLVMDALDPIRWDIKRLIAMVPGLIGVKDEVMRAPNYILKRIAIREWLDTAPEDYKTLVKLFFLNDMKFRYESYHGIFYLILQACGIENALDLLDELRKAQASDRVRYERMFTSFPQLFPPRLWKPCSDIFVISASKEPTFIVNICIEMCRMVALHPCPSAINAAGFEDDLGNTLDQVKDWLR